MNSGITVNSETSKLWNDIRVNDSIDFVRIIINDKDTFEIVSQHQKSNVNAVTASAEVLDSKMSSYLIIRSDVDKNKFYLVWHVPNGARVQQKMLYSSSLAALKTGLGTDHLLGEMYINDKSECTPENLHKSLHPIDRLSLMTFEERITYDAQLDTAGAMDTEAKVAVDLPVQVHPNADAAIKSFAKGEITTIIFELNTETEQLEVEEKGDFDINVAATKLSVNPRFILSNFKYTNPESKVAEVATTFVYFCPDKAKAKARMFYSASKSIVIKILENDGIVRKVNFEASEPAEISSDIVMENLFPVVVEKKVFAKPQPRARGAKSLGVKFSEF